MVTYPKRKRVACLQFMPFISMVLLTITLLPIFFFLNSNITFLRSHTPISLNFTGHTTFNSNFRAKTPQWSDSSRSCSVTAIEGRHCHYGNLNMPTPSATYVLRTSTKPEDLFLRPAGELLFNVTFHLNATYPFPDEHVPGEIRVAESDVYEYVKWPGGTLTWVIFNMPNSTGTIQIDWLGTDKYGAFTLYPNATDQYQYLKPGELGFKQYVFLEDEIGNLIGSSPTDDADARTATPGIRLALNTTARNVSQAMEQTTNNTKQNNNETEKVFVDGWAAFYRKEGKKPLIVPWFGHNLLITFLATTLTLLSLTYYAKRHRRQRL